MGLVTEGSNKYLSLSIMDCRYGAMAVFQHDNVIGRSLRIYGEWAEHELFYLRPYVSRGSVVVDVGANIGTHALAFSEWGAKVVAVEAHPTISSVLEVNCLLNRRGVMTINALCGEKRGWTYIDPDISGTDNVGALGYASLAGRCRRRFLWMVPRLAYSRTVPMVRLDDFVHLREVSLIKVDVEEMEVSVIRGAIRLLRRAQPVLFIEQLNTDKLSLLLGILQPLGYRVYWLETQPFNHKNFRSCPNNVWWRTESALLGVPSRLPPRGDLRIATEGDSAVPAEMDARMGWSGDP